MIDLTLPAWAGWAMGVGLILFVLLVVLSDCKPNDPLMVRDAGGVYRNYEKDLAVELIQDPGGIDLTKADAIVARAAAHDKNKRSDQKRWLFDWDRPIITQTEDQLFNKFCEYVDEYGGGVTVYPTPHGKAILAEHGFDTRELATNYGETADPKRDALLCRMWEYNYYNTRN